MSTVRPWDACRFLDTDPEGDALVAALVAQPQNGTVTLETTGAFTYTASDGTDTNTPVTATVASR